MVRGLDLSECLISLEKVPHSPYGCGLLTLFIPVRLLTSLSLFLAAGVASAVEPAVFTIKTMTAQMKYDVTELVVEPGTPVKLTFENGDDLPHNIVFCQPGTDTAAMAMKQMEKPEEALKRNWLPDDNRIWLHSKLLNPHEKQVLEFTAPSKLGVYPFVCTFPGHALTMKGSLRVFPRGEGLKDLTFKLYLGSWKQLPDFSKLTPHREGSVPDNKIQFKLDDYKNEFGVVFTGKLTAPNKGAYRFYLASDDGGRILIDGKMVVEYDGIHPANPIKEGSVQLEKGDHEFRLEYFQAAGNIELYAAWKGAKFDVTPLSTWLHPNWRGGAKPKEDRSTGMPLIVKDEPVIYRNFIQGAGTRGIGVGYPGGFNIAWSAATMNLALVWRGAFIDAARHWNDRGGGYQPPLGFDVLQPAPEGSLPFFIASSPSADWPKVEPKARADDYQWKGYSLDAKRQPVFSYEWQGLKVQDQFEVEGEGTKADGKLIRTLTIQGNVPENAWFRLAQGAKMEAKDGGFIVDAGRLDLGGRGFENRFRIMAPGATLAGQNLVLPVKAGSIKVTYQWLP